MNFSYWYFERQIIEIAGNFEANRNAMIDKMEVKVEITAVSFRQFFSYLENRNPTPLRTPSTRPRINVTIKFNKFLKFLTHDFPSCKNEAKKIIDSRNLLRSFQYVNEIKQTLNEQTKQIKN